MAVSDGYKVRPSPQREKRDVFKLLLSPANLLLLGVKAGDLCNINTSDSHLGPAIACLAKEKIKDDVVQTSLDLQTLYGFKLNQRIFINPSNEACLRATDITLTEADHDVTDEPSLRLSETDRLFWSSVLQRRFKKDTKTAALFITPGLVFEDVEVQGESRSFQIQKVNSSDRRILYCVESNDNVCVAIQSSREDEYRALSISTHRLGGLRKQLEQINDIIGFYREPYVVQSYLHSFLQPCKGGIIFHGASGTGKSLVLREISEAGWQGVFHVDDSVLYGASGGVRSALSRIFSNALGAQPSVIMIDDLDSINARMEVQDAERSINVARLLCEQFDRLGNDRVLVVGAVRRLSDVDERLRQAGRLEEEIEIPIPDSASRAEILKVLSGLPKESAHPLLDSIAARTHGFVGANLKLLRNKAKKLYLIRNGLSKVEGSRYGPDEAKIAAIHQDMEVDFDRALSLVHPTALQNIFIEPPNVKWTAIGGQHKVKKVLQQAVVWPFKHTELMKNFGAEPRKGLLLYGPPGCSKTMVAKAAATESGLNFIAVRGPELMRMYVGESERALREVFSKARAVRPSIVFFDEIDAIGATVGTGQHGAVQTVTTLLNELDGFETMEGVFVLAATNKPEILDPALIRAGRLDTTLYIGLPDVEARRDILRIQMLSMPLGQDINEQILSEATEGLSGAEIVQVCKQARWAAMEAVVESQEEQLVSQYHFISALAEVQKSVTVEMVKRYEAWGAGRH